MDKNLNNILKMLLKIDKMFSNIYFDIEEQDFNGLIKYCIYVSNLEFYLSTKFKSISKIMKNKYKVKNCYFCYKNFEK